MQFWAMLGVSRITLGVHIRDNVAFKSVITLRSLRNYDTPKTRAVHPSCDAPGYIVKAPRGIPALRFWSHGLWCFGAYQGGSGVKGKTKKDLFWDKFFQGFQSAVAAVSNLGGQTAPR